MPTKLITENKISIELKRLEKKEGFLSKTEDLEKIKWCKHKMIDSHVHIINFMQETEWLEKLLYYMNKTNIKSSVVFWMPVKKNWWEHEKKQPEYYLDDDNECYYYSFTDGIVAEEYNKLSQKNKERFYPLICWFNPMDINAIKHIENMFKFYPWVFCGIWEILLRHDDLTFLTQWEAPRLSNKAIFPILEFATEYDLPVLIHNNISAPWVSDHPKYLNELESILREFPKTKIIFAHCGVSRRVYAPYYAKMIKRLLDEYPSLYMDYSWAVFEEVIAKDEKSLEEWALLSEEFSDRILIWSDILGKDFHRIWFINHKFNKLLAKLSKKAIKNITINNAEFLFGWRKWRVENNERRKYPRLEDIII
ncbi:MAG: 5-oxoprolinase (ATP-hydrolysing) [uncultured bacterium (gcode 4)]|uniref:5-oxoprolinase (ATP-hydrolysing) n=1 Tax=uncultured bacterium (gcode 4) TaxID=1234023 RepID=K2BBI3_9BACT|nr:MAG: 5-oxoprolinase (ATP-hydrolysing) [uncultured bacterium (gcode 4)]